MYTDLFLALLNEKNARTHGILLSLVYGFCPAAAYWWLSGAVPEQPFDPIWRALEDRASGRTLRDHLLRYGFENLIEEVRKYIDEVGKYRTQYSRILSPEIYPFFPGGTLDMGLRFGSQNAIENFGGDWRNLFSYVRTWAFLSQDWRSGMGIDVKSDYTFCAEKVHLVLPTYRLPIQFDVWLWKVSVGHITETKIGLLGRTNEQDQLRFTLMRYCQPMGEQPWQNTPTVHVLDPLTGESKLFERKFAKRYLESIVDFMAERAVKGPYPPLHALSQSPRCKQCGFQKICFQENRITDYMLIKLCQIPDPSS